MAHMLREVGFLISARRPSTWPRSDTAEGQQSCAMESLTWRPADHKACPWPTPAGATQYKSCPSLVRPRLLHLRPPARIGRDRIIRDGIVRLQTTVSILLPDLGEPRTLIPAEATAIHASPMRMCRYPALAEVAREVSTNWPAGDLGGFNCLRFDVLSPRNCIAYDWDSSALRVAGRATHLPQDGTPQPQRSTPLLLRTGTRRCA